MITIFPTDIDPATCWELRYYGSSNIFQAKMGPDSQDQAVGCMQHDVNPICIWSMEDVPTLTYLNVKMGPMGPMGIVHLVARSWQGSPERMKSMLLAQWEARENQGNSPSIGGANTKNHGKNHCVSCEGFHLATWRYTPIQHFIWFCGVVHVFGAELE